MRINLLHFAYNFLDTLGCEYKCKLTFQCTDIESINLLDSAYNFLNKAVVVSIIVNLPSDVLILRVQSHCT